MNKERYLFSAYADAAVVTEYRLAYSSKHIRKWMHIVNIRNQKMLVSDFI